MLISCIMISCSEDSSDNSQNVRYVKKLNVIIPDLLIGDETTTMSVVRENSSLQLLPSTNDSIGVFPDDDFQIGFSMTNGEGFKRALSGGKSLILKDSATYSAYYPYVSQFDLDKSNIPMRMNEQTQNGNGSSDHIGYMAAINAKADEEGGVTFTFQHLTGVLHLQFVMPNAANIRKVLLLSNGRFTTEAVLNLRDSTITAKNTSTVQNLNLRNVSVEKDQELELYLNILPVDLSGKNVHAKIYDDNGICYTATWEGKDYKAGSLYKVEKNAEVDAAMNSGLPIVFIDTPNNTNIESKTEWMEGTSISIIDTDGTMDYSNNHLQIRGRGNSTWEFPKKPYALKLDNKAEILGMPKHKRWCLLANWMDRTLMRNDVSFQIARQTGLAWTPRGQFVEVVLNGSHIGNYYLCEQIRAGKDRVNITEMEATDIEGDAITGGYLVELDTNFDEVNKFHSAIANMPYQFQEPDEDVLQPEQMAWFEGYINEMESNLYAKDWLANREYADYMDLNSFVDWWFVQELADNREPGHPKSSFMHKDRNGKLTAGPVWDFDWGTFMLSRAETYSIKDFIYYGRLFEDPVFVSIVKERWAMHKSKFDNIPDYIRTVAAKIKKSNETDKTIWPMDSTVNEDQDMTFDEAVEHMIMAYKTKLQWLDEEIGDM